jgi:molybdopterin molybdotransferase
MLTVEEALEQVLAHARPRPPVCVAARDALGLTLAEEVTSDVDSPPYDKTMVDGYAVLAADLTEGVAELTILEEVIAGSVPRQPVTPGHATRLMTGAPIPANADAMVMIERTEVVGAAGRDLGRVRIQSEPVKPGQNIIRRGVSMRTGDVVLAPGTEIRPIDIGLLAEVGREQLMAVPRPTVAVLATGNELVPPGVTPGPGQIRNSNGPMLLAAIERAGATPVDLGIVFDDPHALRARVAEGLKADILVLSGGVSAGVMDLVPGVLAHCGVHQVFHKIRLKPGKPLWFGTAPDPAGDKLAFGLPGNPVSTLVCFELFVRPAIARLAGRTAEGLRTVRAKLGADFNHRGDRPTYHPAVWHEEDNSPTVTPVRWTGSADLRGLATANALIHFPAGDRTWEAGKKVEVLLL